MNATDFEFCPFTETLVVLLHRWLQEPHVRAFWDDGHRTLEQVRSHYFRPRSVEQYLGLYQKTPIAYIQATLIESKDPLAKFCPPHKETYGVDFFTGEKDFIGKKLSVPLLQAFAHFLVEKHPNCQALLFDPSENNPRAIHIYSKLGALPVGLYDKKEIQLWELPRVKSSAFRK